MTNQPKHVTGKLRTVGRTIVALENNWAVATTYDCDFTAEQQEANAFELVRRWNCHDELVKAIEDLMLVSEHIDLAQGLTMEQLFPKRFEAARTALKHAME